MQLRRTLALASALFLGAAAPAATQNNGADLHSAADPDGVAPVPFGLGERLGYKVSLGVFGEVGSGAMEVLALDTIHGRPTYHLRFTLKGGVLFAKVDDTLQSWLDVSTLTARRFEQNQKEVNYERHRTFDFYPEQGIWKRLENGETGELATPEPLDDVSFLYFIRTIPLEVGKTYTFDRYYKDSGNPVIVQVLRKETVTVPAGTFETIVVRPIIKTKGLFGEGGEAEVYFTDDHRRLVVQMKSKVPVIGSLGLQLQSYTPGEKLAAKAAPTPSEP
jgi:hypothetical protein